MGSTGLVFLCFVASLACGALAVPTFNVADRGAIGDGKTDDGKAFTKTWAEACAHPGSPTFFVPSGKTFLLSMLKFGGPCKSPIHVQVDGDLVAPNQVWKASMYADWITFHRINGLIIDGKGQLNGNGAVWWKCREDHKCSSAPNLLAMDHCSDVQLSGLKFIDSPKKHISIGNSVRVNISGLTITAPESSPNTDGLYTQSSQKVEIADSIIGTGDDCIAIGTGSSDLEIRGVTCGPGHGISVGSLGKDGSEAAVEHIHVSDCKLHNTTNGVRIKTWQGGSGYAKGITFENIKFTSVKNPIIIDQYYCDSNYDCPTKASAVEVSDVHYIGLQGTSASDVAINLNCSQSVPCSGIRMNSINFKYVGDGRAEAICSNAHGTKKDEVIPAVPCLA